MRGKTSNSLRPVNKNTRLIKGNLTELETLRSEEAEAERKIRSAVQKSEKISVQAEDESSAVMNEIRARLMAELSEEYKASEINARRKSRQLVKDAKVRSVKEKAKAEPRVKKTVETILLKLLEEG